MSRMFLYAVLIALASPALADEAAPRPDSPVSSDIKCYPLADIRRFVDGAGGALVQLTPEQFQFARGLFVGAPPVSTALPPGDRALMGVVNDRVGILFIDGDKACDGGVLPPTLRQMLLDVGAGKVNHDGGGI
jgi:hypothetical protein